MDTLGWEVLINRRSSSWRELDPETRSSMDAASAIQAALATPTLIKRPLLSHGGTLETGFSAARYAEIFRC
jgi:arsenate reductase